VDLFEKAGGTAIFIQLACSMMQFIVECLITIVMLGIFVVTLGTATLAFIYPEEWKSFIKWFKDHIQSPLLESYVGYNNYGGTDDRPNDTSISAGTNRISAATSASSALLGAPLPSNNLIQQGLVAGASLFIQSYNSLRDTATKGVSLPYDPKSVPKDVFRMKQGDTYTALYGSNITGQTPDTSLSDFQKGLGVNPETDPVYVEVNHFCMNAYTKCVLIDLDEVCKEKYLHCIQDKYMTPKFTSGASFTGVSLPNTPSSSIGASGTTATGASAAAYSPSEIRISPDEYIPHRYKTMNVQSPTDIGPQIDAILQNSTATPSVRQHIRNELQFAVNDEIKNRENNIYQINYVFE